MKLSDGSVEIQLIATNFSIQLQSDFSPVRAYKSNWFATKSPNVGTISITFMQGSITAQEAAAGLCQRWLKDNTSLYFSYPEFGIDNWIVFIQTAPFTFQYDKPVNPCTITLKSVTNWYYSQIASLPSQSNIYSIFGNGIVSKGINSLEDADQVAQWLASHEQFNGISIQYLNNGNITIKYSNGEVLNNVKPTYQLLQNLIQYGDAHAPSNNQQNQQPKSTAKSTSKSTSKSTNRKIWRAH